jgi:hypothetical protein
LVVKNARQLANISVRTKANNTNCMHDELADASLKKARVERHQKTVIFTHIRVAPDFVKSNPARAGLELTHTI